jgi:hypothetical protein
VQEGVEMDMNNNESLYAASDMTDVEQGRANNGENNVSRRSSFLGRALEDMDVDDSFLPSDSIRRLSRNTSRESILPFDLKGDEHNLMGSPESYIRRLSHSSRSDFSQMDEHQISQLMTPDVNVPFSQFEIPMKDESFLSSNSFKVIKQLGKVTEIFRRILSEGFDKAFREKKKSPITFQSTLHIAVPEGQLVVKDVAMSFMQLLILKSMNIVRTQQVEAYGDIHIIKGKEWMRFNIAGSLARQ